MPDLMTSADMAISAGGSTCWELCYVGVPFIVGIIANNQEEIAYGLSNAGAALNCGWFRSLDSGRLAVYIDEMIADQNMRKNFSDIGRTLIDGLGPERVIRAMTMT